jgi:hypothetical protein
VTSNPLAGYERMPFEQAVLQAKTNLTLRFSDAVMFHEQYRNGEIDVY